MTKLYLLYEEDSSMIVIHHYVAIVSSKQIADKFESFKKLNRSREFIMDDPTILKLIKKGTTKKSWSESWRDVRYEDN
jgi:hypothetical protein